MQVGAKLEGQDYIDLYKYFRINKHFVSEEERKILEPFVVKGIPEGLRRKYWLSISGAYGYLNHYSEGYYQTLVKDDDERAYPTWPHPDY